MVRTLLFLAAAITVASPAQAFDPFKFFSGATRGDGTLAVAMKSKVPIRVESHGRTDGKGGLVLEQTVREGSKPATKRRWFLRQTSGNQLTGTISDNPGQVRGRIVGESLFLNYPVKGGMKAEQVLTPVPGGKAVQNRITVKRLGFVVARIHEIIRKLD